VECGKTYANKSNLNKHLRNLHGRKTGANNFNNQNYPDSGEVAINKTPICHKELFDNHGDTNYSNLNGTESTPKFDPIGPKCTENTLNTNHQCKYCLAYFTRSTTLRRHIQNSCKIRKQDTEEKERIYQKLLKQMDIQNEKMEAQAKEIQQLKQQLAVSTSSYSNSHNNCNNITNNTQNNNNIQINNDIKVIGFGKEDLYAIEDKVVKQLLNRGLNAVRETIRYTHLNKNDEKHHNVYVSNMKDVYAMIYDGKKWKITNKKEVIDTLYDDKHLFLKGKYNDIYDELPPIARKKFDRYLELENDKETTDIIKKEILLMLYNNKEIPLSTKRKMEGQKTITN
jgi:hypothetical protein